jgi:ribosomal protein S18 acetylase RimI-like enzyme
MPQPPSIVRVHENDFADFIAYLNDHLADNGGSDAGYFQPLPREQSFFPTDRAAAFRAGLATAVGSKGWRRAWVARAADGRIAGHIDLRAHAEGFAQHRCLLGMGVDRHCRRAGLGMALIAHAREWAADVAKLSWIDLQVIGENRAAIGLYQRAGFAGIGNIPDMFRIDGKSFSYATMSLRLAD